MQSFDKEVFCLFVLQLSVLNCCPVSVTMVSVADITFHIIYFVLFSLFICPVQHIQICLITALPLEYYTQTHTLSGPSLAELASLFVEAIKVGKMGSGKSLELFPTVLTALSACEALSYGKGECKLLAWATISFYVISKRHFNVDTYKVQMIKDDESWSPIVARYFLKVNSVVRNTRNS